MDRLFALILTFLAATASAAAPAETPASAPTEAPAAVAPEAGSPTAEAEAGALSPTADAAPAPLSPSAGSDEPMVPEEMEDPMAVASQAVLTDLKPLSSTVLAKLAAALGPEQEAVWLDAESGEAADADAAGVARVDAMALYGELAWRLARHDDKDARAALGLALMKKDSRAKEAKDLAFEDKLADSVIAQLPTGGAKAEAELKALAAKGNRRARQHLGLDTPPPAAAPEPVSGTAQAATPTAAPVNPAPEALSSGAKP